MRGWNRGVLAASLIAALGVAAPAAAGVVEYELTIAEREVNLTGKPVRALTVNGTIPGPTLHFREGETARIRVRNELAEETSVHWHGLLVPPGMDGVPWVSFPPIAPGTVFTYEFPLRQAGTYWYHSHSGLQEQRGVYGAIVIEPGEPAGGTDRDYAVVLSDWTDEPPARVMRTLKRGSHAYALEKGSAQSLFGALRAGMAGDFLSNQLQRMPPMDIADVAYDRFLANGRPEIALEADGLDSVRLRVVNGSATTYFHLEFAGGPMTIVAADGQEVKPVAAQRLLIAVAETYDLVVMVPPDGAWELRATAHDGSAAASVWIGAGEPHRAPAVPRPNVYRAMAGPGLAEIFALTPQGAMGMSDARVRAGVFDRPGMMPGHEHGHGAQGGGHDGGHGDGHAGGHEGVPADRERAGGMAQGPERLERSGRRHARDFSPLGPDAASLPELAEEGTGPERPWPPYARLRATRQTAFPAERPVREIRLTLDGDMERYVWFLNGRPLWEEDTIPIRGGEVVRLIMVNRTMMHHPMHLHGHFFRVLNGQGDRAPLKHTVDVAPMSTTVIEFAAEEPGDWLFHCHLLYHMESGMARVVRYEGFDPGPVLAGARHRVHEDHWYAWGEADLLSSLTEGRLTLSRTRDIVTLGWEAGWGTGEREAWDARLLWDRSFNRFLALFAGGEYGREEGEEVRLRGVGGMRYLLPLVIESEVLLDTEGALRLALGKELPLLPRLEAFGEVAYDTREGWDGAAGLAYALGRSVSVVGRWDSTHGWGAGLRLRF